MSCGPPDMPWWRRAANVFRIDQVQRELDEELEAHVEEAILQGRYPMKHAARSGRFCIIAKRAATSGSLPGSIHSAPIWYSPGGGWPLRRSHRPQPFCRSRWQSAPARRPFASSMPCCCGRCRSPTLRTFILWLDEASTSPVHLVPPTPGRTRRSNECAPRFTATPS